VPDTSFEHLFPDNQNRFFNPVPIIGGETLTDPVGKLRVSTPQSLIDTDFEYGTQSTKWETLNLLNNRPSAFYDVTAPITFTDVTGAGTRVVTVSAAGSGSGVLVVGTPIFVQSTTSAAANGWFLIDSVSAGTSFTYTANATVASGSIFDTTKTYIFAGNFYTNAGIPVATGSSAAFVNSGTTVTCTTTNSHGLTVGDAIFVRGTTATTNPPNGAWIVQTTPTSNTFTFTVINTPTGGNITAAGGATGTLYPRPYGSVIHRSFDGGVAFSAGYPYSGNQIIRQTRRYFRYQSGKGIQFSTGTCLKPVFNVNSITSSGATVTVNLATPHNLNGNFNSGQGIAVSASAGAAFTNNADINGGLTITCVTTNVHGFLLGDTIVVKGTTATTNPPNGTWIISKIISTTSFQFIATAVPTGSITATAGATSTLYAQPGGPYVTVSNCTQSAYNGTFLVQTIPSDTSFTYTAAATPSSSPATGFPITVSPQSWYGSKSRIGLFEEQNGFFFEFDGQTLYVVKRSSVAQLSGTIAVNNGSVSVTGTGTTFSSQLSPGDYIVIRGITCLVQSIVSNTSIIIYPEYRGTNVSNCVASKRIEEKYPQSIWNMDRCDGSGASGFVLDLTKMQMLYIDFAWYGAGAIRFGFKNQNGEIIYCHRIPNSNRNTEAYMRSGNIPARYEANFLTTLTTLASTLSSSAVDVITVASTAGFPRSGFISVTASGNTGAVIEYIQYNSKTETTFTGLTRGVTNLVGPGGLTAGGGGTAQTFTYSATAPISIALFSAQFSSTLSHWGSAVIMDGRYDDDKGFVFQAGMNSALSNLGNGLSALVLAIRLAPSVDSGLTGILGARDLINRMQLTLRQMDVLSTGSGASFRIELILNGAITGATPSFVAVGGSSLSQTYFNTNAGVSVSGGESIFSFFTYSPGVTQQDLTLVRDLGNSILGGGTSLSIPTSSLNLYPDGPDVVYVKVTNVGSVATNSISCRLSWTEAQA